MTSKPINIETPASRGGAQVIRSMGKAPRLMFDFLDKCRAQLGEEIISDAELVREMPVNRAGRRAMLSARRKANR